MATVPQDVQAVRTAVYGRDVREAIADAIENCWRTINTSVLYELQNATTAQQQIARMNIGAIGISEVDAELDKAVRHDKLQSLSDLAKTYARTNIAAALITDLAPAFSASVSYTAGSYVTYNGKVYRFIRNHSGSFVGSDVEQVPLSTMVDTFGTMLNRAVLHAEQQNLTDIAKRMARLNINAACVEDLAPAFSSSVLYKEGTYVTRDGRLYRFTMEHQPGAFVGTDTEQVPLSTVLDGGPVLYNKTQTLLDGQKTTARNNIGAASSSALNDLSDDVNDLADALTDLTDSGPVLYNDAQSLSNTQKTTARTNIGAVSQADFDELSGDVDDLKEDIAYTPVNVSAFSVSPNKAEMGSTVTSISYSYTVNKVPETLTIDSSSITPARTGSGTLSVNLTSSKTYTMTATDTGSPSHSAASSSKTAAVTFMNNIYYGSAAIPETVNSAFVASLTKELSATKKSPVTISVASGQYAWYALPKRLGTCSFNVGGFDGGFETPLTVSVTNASGYSENYYVYRSTNPSLGPTTITVT